MSSPLPHTFANSTSRISYFGAATWRLQLAYGDVALPCARWSVDLELTHTSTHPSTPSPPRNIHYSLSLSKSESREFILNQPLVEKLVDLTPPLVNRTFLVESEPHTT